MGKLKHYYEKRQEGKKYSIWLWKQMKPWLPAVIVVSILGSALSVVSVGMSQMNKWLVDAATGDTPFFNGKVFALLCIVTLVNMAVNSILNIWQTFLYEKQSFRMRKRFYGQILGADWQSLTRFHSGDLMTRITSDVDTVANGVFHMIPQFVSIICQFLTAFLLLYHYDPVLSILILAISPLGLLVSVWLGRVYQRFQKESRENEAVYRSFMQESTENITIVKSFSVEQFFQEKLEVFWNKRYDIIKKRSYVSFWINIAMTLVFSGGYLIAFGWSTMRLSKGEITYGTLTLLLTLISRVQGPVQSLQGQVQQIVNLIVSAGRIMEISECPLEKEERKREIDGALGIGAKKLRFTYQKSEQSVLKNLSFDIEPGETVGIIGNSGEGKTTLIRLMLALTKPDGGELYLYNAKGNRESISTNTRSYFKYVPQGNTLMSGTIRENLQLGNPEATEEELWSGLEIAEAAEFVKKLPEGLDSRIAEKGGAISEGQAQRLAIARALIKPGRILILDEATASLDIGTEARIIRNLELRVKDMTCVVVTHRLSLLDICQKIYKIENGQLQYEEERAKDEANG